MRLVKWKNILFILIAIFFVYYFINFPFEKLKNLSDGDVLTQAEFNSLKSSNFINSDLLTNAFSPEYDEEIKEYVVKYKLFNLINIKNLKVKVVDNLNFYAGGDCLGFSLRSKGTIIVGGNYILTNDGKKNPFKDSGLKIGDVIIKLNDFEINNSSDIVNFLEGYIGPDSVNCTVIRENEILNFSIAPALDIQSKSYKLGVWVKDTTLGVGTLTFLNDKTSRFGALGHAVSIGDNKKGYDISDGSIYDCRVIGVKEGESGKAGQLMGTFSEYQKPLGNVDKNCEYGVFGNLTEDALIEFIEKKSPILIGGRATVKPGKAKILSCIDGKKIRSYDIEIIKTNFQKSSNEKSMILRVIDAELLKKTGGIVQGMSGSPIIQNGKLVGAVTHVFLNDASKGFGIYIDWMVEQ